MVNYNLVVMAGNLTRDPQHRRLASGQGVCRLSLAVNRQYKNKQTGNTVQEVCYVDIDVWGAQAESCRQYLQKGRPILVEGRLKYDSWEDAQGQTRTRHTIVAERVMFLSFPAGGPGSGNNTESVEPDTGSQHSDPTIASIEKEIMNQIEAIKSKPKTTAAKSQPTPAASDVEFKDEPPFQDELPF